MTCGASTAGAAPLVTTGQSRVRSSPNATGGVADRFGDARLERLCGRERDFLSERRQFRRLSDSLDAFVAAGKRPRREVAITFNSVPAILDAADVRLVFIDVTGSRQRRAPVRKDVTY